MSRIPVFRLVRRNRVIGLGSVVLALAAGVTPAQATPDWRKDGRPGYATADLAGHVARQFTAQGAPREGLDFQIARDPDGGFTPVFFDRRKSDGFGV